jgi:hypothetical protein
MRIGKYETTILRALKDRIFVSKSHPKQCWWFPTDGWITNPTEIIKAIRLDDELGIAPNPKPITKKGK